MKNITKSKIEEMNKKWKKDKKLQEKGRKKGKEGSKVCHPRWAPKLMFHIRSVSRNRNEIDAQKKNQILSTQQRK